MGERNQVKGITCRICGKVYRLNKGLLNGIVNHLDMAYLSFGSYNKVSEAVRKIHASWEGFFFYLDALSCLSVVGVCVDVCLKVRV